MLAINAMFKLPKGELLLPDAPELIDKVIRTHLAFRLLSVICVVDKIRTLLILDTLEAVEAIEATTSSPPWRGS